MYKLCLNSVLICLVQMATYVSELEINKEHLAF